MDFSGIEFSQACCEAYYFDSHRHSWRAQILSRESKNSGLLQPEALAAPLDQSLISRHMTYHQTRIMQV